MAVRCAVNARMLVRLQPQQPFKDKTMVKIESGETPNPTIETVKKIADPLGVSLDDLDDLIE